MANILIIESSRSIRLTLKDRLETEHHKVWIADTISNGVRQIAQNSFDCIITDCFLPNSITTPWIILTKDNSSEFAEKALSVGAYDCITKPIDMPKLSAAIRRASQEESSQKPQNGAASTPIVTKKSSISVDKIIGNALATLHLRKVIDLVAPTPARVLITGENGTGKELVARWLHKKSSRSNGPFVEVNCAAIPSELIESELFGHEKGAFTSAIKNRIGKFEQANGGTLFLDEIGDMSLAAQAKMLRVLQEQTITHVGGNASVKIDVRIVAATNKNLYEEVTEHRFREDLYHRLSVVIINTPPLRERKDDIPILIHHFLQQLSDEYSLPLKDVDKDALAVLRELPYTGNIRQLRNICERLLILSQNHSITLTDVQAYASTGAL